MLPCSERRALLEEIIVESQRVRVVATFEDGEALFAAVCARGLEVSWRSVSATRTAPAAERG